IGRLIDSFGPEEELAPDDLWPALVEAAQVLETISEVEAALPPAPVPDFTAIFITSGTETFRAHALDDLRLAGFSPSCFSSAKEALDHLQKHRVDVAILDGAISNVNEIAWNIELLPETSQSTSVLVTEGSHPTGLAVPPIRATAEMALRALVLA